MYVKFQGPQLVLKSGLKKKKKKKKRERYSDMCVLAPLLFLSLPMFVGGSNTFFSVAKKLSSIAKYTKVFSCSTKVSASNLYWLYIENLANFRISTLLVLILYRLESIKKVTHGVYYYSKCWLVSIERYLIFHLPQKIVLCTSIFRTHNLYQEYMTKWTKFRISTVLVPHLYRIESSKQWPMGQITIQNAA